MRVQIARRLKNRSKAIRAAVQSYNNAAVAASTDS
jgi:metal-responsive CopG/Arc/MetJ family transcriptional regulator